MAAPDEPRVRPGRERGRQPIQPRMHRPADGGEPAGLETRLPAARQIAVEHQPHPRHAVHTRPDRGGGHQRGGCIGERIQHPAIQPAPACDGIEEIPRRHGRHAEHPIHHLPCPRQGQGAIGSARHGQDVAIDAGGVGAVQFQLPPAEMLASGEGAKVQEGQRDGLLQLEGLGRAHEDGGDMRLDGRGPGDPREQGGDVGLLCGDGHG